MAVKLIENEKICVTPLSKPQELCLKGIKTKIACRSASTAVVGKVKM